MFEKQNHTRKKDSSLQLLTVQEVSRMLSLGDSTIYLLMKRRELPCVRIGRSVRVRYDDLMEFINLKAKKAGSQ